MALAEIVRCAGGLTVAQRGADLSTAPPPSLRVDEIRPVEAPESPPIEVQRDDGVVWRRHWSTPDRLIVDFVDVGWVQVRDGVVVFDRELDEEMEQHLLLDHILPLVLARQGHLVLHGGVISRDGAGVVLVGATGAGKSTLTGFAWQQGWTVGGDDGAVVHPSRPPRVEPTYATVRLSAESADLLGIDPEMRTAITNKLRITAPADRAFRQEVVDLALVAVIEPGDDGPVASLERIDPIAAHARLFGSTFHADLERARSLPVIIEGLAVIVETTPVVALTVPRGADGLASAEGLLRDLLASTVTTVGPR
jgi:hypothetical protein